jgi:hypothetical protein
LIDRVFFHLPHPAAPLFIAAGDGGLPGGVRPPGNHLVNPVDPVKK